MAVGLSVVEKNLEDLEKEVTCPVCQEHYTDPKILPCLHYYCKQCVLELSTKAGKNKLFSCPECRKNTTLPEGGVEEMKSAFFVNRLKSLYVKHKKAVSKKVCCEMCDSPQAVAEAFCQQCDKFACQNCVHMHSTMKRVFEGHKMLSVDQLQTINDEELVPSKYTLNKCPVHEELLKIFCFSCNKIICRDCTVKDHKDHNIEFNNVAAKNTKKQLLEDLKYLRAASTSLSGALEEVRKTEHEVEAQSDSVAKIIETSFKEFHSILNARKQQLLEESKRRAREKTENLKGQEKNLSIAKAQVLSVVDHTEHLLRHCSDYEVMSMHVAISHRIKEEGEHCPSGNVLEPVATADIGVEAGCAHSLKQLCQKVKITGAADYMEVVAFPGIVEVNEEIKIQVKNANSIEAKVILESGLKCLPDGPVSKSNIEVINPNVYEISCTPRVRGLHEITFSVNGIPIDGSPFSVTVQLPPTQLDNPLHVKDYPSPYAIIVNSVGEIVVGSYGNGYIDVMDEKGKTLRVIKHSEHMINKLSGISVDQEDNIYFVGRIQNKIAKYSTNTQKLLVKEIEQVKGRGYLDIKVVGDEVMVTEQHNDGQVMVYNTMLNFIKIINGVKKTMFRNLNSDSHRNLYISTSDATIQVIDKSGNTLKSFSCDGNGVQQLKCPYTIYVFGQYIYVTDNILNKMVVFSTEGKYVTSFGCYGGICITKEGTVFVSNYRNNRIDRY